MFGLGEGAWNVEEVALGGKEAVRESGASEWRGSSGGGNA